MAKNSFLEFVEKLTDEEKVSLISVIEEQVGKKKADDAAKPEPVKKKRGRPKKVQPAPEVVPATNNGFVDAGPKTKEEKKIAEVSKILSQTKNNTDFIKRPEIKLVTVFCRNCRKPTELPSNFPDLDKFVCCVG